MQERDLPSSISDPRSLLSFFPVQSERFRRRSVIDRKQDRVFTHRVLVRVPLPRRHDEDIAFGPIELIGRDSGHSLTAKSVVNRRARVSMRFGLLLRSQQLDRTGAGLKRVAAVYRIGVLQ